MLNWLTAGAGGGPIPKLDATADPNLFLYGKGKNDAPAGSGTGTGVTIAMCLEPMQAMWAVLRKANIAPSENEENTVVSDFVTALQNLFGNVGDIKLHYGAVSPTNSWLIMDGSTYDLENDYPELYALLGNSNDVPDWRGKVPVMLDTTDVDFDEIGKFSGAKTVSLTANQNGLHSHSLVKSSAGHAVQGGAGSIAADDPASSTTLPSGAGEAHDNVQPSAVANFLIKAR